MLILWKYLQHVSCNMCPEPELSSSWRVCCDPRPSDLCPLQKHSEESKNLRHK